jgi:hypothetical protein
MIIAQGQIISGIQLRYYYTKMALEPQRKYLAKQTLNKKHRIQPRLAFINGAGKSSKNKTENHFSHYPRSQVDINSYTRLNIATSLNCEKNNKLLVKVEISKSGRNWSKLVGIWKLNQNRKLKQKKLQIANCKLQIANWLPGKTAGQGCRARLPGKAAGQGCRARLPGKAAGQGRRARLAGKAGGQV